MFIFRVLKVLLKLICLMLETRVAHFFGMLKGKSIYMKYPCLLSDSEKIYSKTLPNLGTQIICAQNQCTAVKMTQKYPNIYVIPKYIYVYIYKYVCMYIYICMHAYIYVCTFTYVCSYIVYIYIDR